MPVSVLIYISRHDMAQTLPKMALIKQ